MQGIDLKNWRKKAGLSQVDLMRELGVSSRQTISNWENSEHVPRLVELAVTALDQVEECRRIGGYQTQLTEKTIARRHFESWQMANAEITKK